MEINNDVSLKETKNTKTSKTRAVAKKDVEEVYRRILSGLKPNRFTSAKDLMNVTLPDGTHTKLTNQFHVAKPHSPKILYDLGYLEVKKTKENPNAEYLSRKNILVKRSVKPLPELNILTLEALGLISESMEKYKQNNKKPISNDNQLEFEDENIKTTASETNNISEITTEISDITETTASETSGITETTTEANDLYKRFYKLKNRLDEINEEKLRILEEIDLINSILNT